MTAKVYVHPTALDRVDDLQRRTGLVAAPTHEGLVLELLPEPLPDYACMPEPDYPEPHDSELMPCFGCDGYTCVCAELEGDGE